MLVPWSSCADREIASLRSRCRSSRLLGGKEGVFFDGSLTLRNWIIGSRCSKLCSRLHLSSVLSIFPVV
jgi:hypothetical protein